MVPTSEKAIFLTALGKGSAPEREAFLAEACADNPQLHAEVAELLRAHDRSGNLLDSLPPGVGAEHANLELPRGTDRVMQPGVTGDYPPVAERLGTVIGPYKLMEQIGEGGFGLVFVAEQQRPVRRKVALKLIKPGMDTRDVIGRFEAERQALALMDHPNIAKVLDAGATETGQPYFVMELVRGIPITDFCDQNQLTPRERLELFVHVCYAVQHAHQKGIIHRDLKPSNVLVTLHDSMPVPKVIDFGILKAVGQSLTDKTIYTRFAQMIGTPLYMSPEQAEMSGQDIDTRSDIYSLGVLLYELLTGTTPFDRERLQTATFDEIRRIIREEEPPRPSTRLTTLGIELSTVSAKRKTDPRKLSGLVRGDLDWIVMKALEKDRTRRYDAASALALDVRRFLNEKPIDARPPSALYRFRKFARRNKVVLTAASLVSAALVLGTVISVWQAARAVAERDEKEQARQDAVRARNEANEARKNVEEFAERFKAANILLASGRVHADAGRWSAAKAEYTHATELQPDHYLVWTERGSLYLRLGLWKLAASDYARALELGAPARGPAWWGIPQLFAYVDDDRHQRELLAEMLGQLEATSDGISVVELRASVLAARPAADPADMARRAEKLLTDTPDRPFGPPPVADRPPQPRPERDRDDASDRPPGQPRENGRPPARPDEFPPGGPGRPFGPGRGMAWYPRGASLYVAGLAHLRAGDFDRAVERLQESLMRDFGWPARSIAYAGLAMAHHRAGHATEAREALVASEHAIDEWTEAMFQGPVGTMPLPWFDWIECQLLYHEAKVLLTGFAPPDDPRLRTIEQRALGAISQ